MILLLNIRQKRYLIRNLTKLFSDKWDNIILKIKKENNNFSKDELNIMKRCFDIGVSNLDKVMEKYTKANNAEYLRMAEETREDYYNASNLIFNKLRRKKWATIKHSKLFLEMA